MTPVADLLDTGMVRVYSGGANYRICGKDISDFPHIQVFAGAGLTVTWTVHRLAGPPYCLRAVGRTLGRGRRKDSAGAVRNQGTLTDGRSDGLIRGRALTSMVGLGLPYSLKTHLGTDTGENRWSM